MSDDKEPEPVLMGVEQTNTSVRFHDSLCLKLYRRIEVGVSPEIEMCGALTEKPRSRAFPATLAR